MELGRDSDTGGQVLKDVKAYIYRNREMRSRIGLYGYN